MLWRVHRRAVNPFLIGNIVGSTPTTPTIFALVAQLAEALDLNPKSFWFKSRVAHQVQRTCSITVKCQRLITAQMGVRISPGPPTLERTKMVFDNRKTQEEIVVEGERILNRIVGIAITVVIGFLVITFM